MPTVLQIRGWRFFFFANERNEPIHIHCNKAEVRCKFRNANMEKLYDINNVALNGLMLSFKANGISVTCDLAKVSDVLAKATKEQLANMVVDPVGVGFHWPALDEDLSVNGILRELGVELPTSELEIEEQAELI